MGTRNITKVVKDGKTVVAQYGQWDGYPEYSGRVALEFLSDPENVKALFDNVDKCWQATDEDFSNMMKSINVEDEFMTMEQSEMFATLYPSMTRNTGVGILEVIANAPDGVILHLDTDFEDDSLFCEGIYTIDFDCDTFKTYFNGYEATYLLSNLPDVEVYLAGYQSWVLNQVDEYV